MSEEKLLKLIGDAIIVISTIGVVGFIVYILMNSENGINWIAILSAIISYIIIVGFGFLFKVVCKIYDKLDIE